MPVRPTLMPMSNSLVVACIAGGFTLDEAWKEVFGTSYKDRVRDRPQKRMQKPKATEDSKEVASEPTPEELEAALEQRGGATSAHHRDRR